MGRMIRGFGAGFAATVVLSLLMLLKAYVGVLPQFNAIAMIADVLNGPMLIGWIGHFVIGTAVWGGLFGLTSHRLPRIGGPGQGLIFGVGAWLAMMVVFMPVAGAGFFALGLGTPVAVATLGLHLVYGLILGAAFVVA